MAKSSKKKPKTRPDLAQNAYRVMMEATGQLPKTSDPDAGKDPAAIAPGARAVRRELRRWVRASGRERQTSGGSARGRVRKQVTYCPRLAHRLEAETESPLFDLSQDTSRQPILGTDPKYGPHSLGR